MHVITQGRLSFGLDPRQISAFLQLILVTPNVDRLLDPSGGKGWDERSRLQCKYRI
jgi:hypothetical protein